MTDVVLQALRGAISKPQRFIRILDQARIGCSAGHLTSLIEKARRVRGFQPNGLIPWTEKRNGLGGLFALSRVPFAHEVLWISCQLSKLKPKLASHLALLDTLTASCRDGELASSLEVLVEHRKRHGASIWLMEAEIGCYSQLGQSSKVTEKLREIEGSAPHSIAAYLGYKFADLYDQETTLGGFQRRLELDQKGLPSEGVRNYVRSRLTGAPRSVKQLCDHLRIESSASYIDAYEALVCVLFHASEFVTVEDLAKLSGYIEPLTELGDVRLLTFTAAINGDEKNSEGQVKQPLNPKNFPNPETIIARAKAMSENKDEGRAITDISPRVEELLADYLSPLLYQRGDLGSCYNQLQTVMVKSRFLPWSHALSAWVNALFFPTVANYCYTLQLIASNYRNCGGAQKLPWAAIYGDNSETGGVISAIADSLANDDQDGLIQALVRLENCTATPRYGVDMAAIAATIYLNRDCEALQRSVKMAIENPSVSVFLPFEHLLDEKMHWNDFSEYDPLDLLIGLHFASIGERESKRKFHLEFACRNILVHNKCNSLVDLLNALNPSDPRAIFILREIMIQKNLRLVGFLRTVEDLERARLDLCGALLSHDKVNAEALLNQMREIFKAQELRNAEMHLESARVYADKEGIKRWAEECFRDEFQQIKKNRASRTVPVLGDIADPFGDIPEKQNLTEHPSGLKERLKDPLFSVGSAIFMRCFWKEDDGLDHFLSLRIRHGSLAGYLRAPLERAHLFSNNAVAATEITSEFWQSCLTKTPPNIVAQLSTILYSFQVGFDEMVELLRTERIQVSSEAKPLGLFKPGFPLSAWDALKTGWEQASSFDELFESVWDAFQVALEISLLEVRDFMDSHILRETERMLDVLRASIGQLGLQDTDQAQIVSAINRATTELQEAIRTVKGWFSFRDPVSTETRLSFGQLIELAQKLFKKARPNFDLRLQHSLVGDVHFSAAYISKITDALFILFDNVFQHSGFDNGADVSLECEWLFDSEHRGRIRILAISLIEDSVDRYHTIQRIELVRSKIANHEQSALVTEGGSGLIKLARIADASGVSGKLDFGLTSGGEFFVEILIEAEYVPMNEDDTKC